MSRRIFSRIGHALWHHRYFWTFILFIILVGFVDENSFWRRYQLRQQNNDLQAEIKKYEEKYNADTKALRELEHSPAAVERVARVNLYMKTADEDIYVIEQ